jgi:hypothetical protein
MLKDVFKIFCIPQKSENIYQFENNNNNNKKKNQFEINRQKKPLSMIDSFEFSRF